jgi:hypothetical protein
VRVSPALPRRGVHEAVGGARHRLAHNRKTAMSARRDRA